MEYFGFCKGITNLNLPNLHEINFYEGYFADFYDNFVQHDMDIDIYLDLVTKYGNNVLEIACGSGRVLVPLLEKNVEIDGLDISKEMLQKAEKKCSRFSPKPKLFCGDMISFESKKKYDIIILAQCSLCLIQSEDNITKLFKNVYKNLNAGGVFVFNYNDIPVERLISDKMTPKYFFNKKNKSFIISTEKVFLEKRISIVNLYSEEVENNGVVNRYISAFAKAILNKNVLNNIVTKTSFLKVDEHSFKTEEGLVHFDILRKEI